jgi:hypothetical protein
MHRFWRTPGVVSMLWLRKKLQALQKVKLSSSSFQVILRSFRQSSKTFMTRQGPNEWRLVRSCMDGSTKGVEDRALDITVPHKKLTVTCICLLDSRVKMALAVLVKLAESERTSGIYPTSHRSRRCKFLGVRPGTCMQNEMNYNMSTLAGKGTRFAWPGVLNPLHATR